MNQKNNHKLLWILPSLLGCALFLEAVDITSVTTAIPKMALEFHVSALALKTTIMSYLLTMAICIPISGWLADRFGTKKVFLNAMLLFCLASIACGLSINLPTLIIARLFQGIAGGIILPVGRLLIYQNFEKKQLANVLPKAPLFGLIGYILGPVLGGALTTYLSWRFIFFINVPIILLAIPLILKYVPNKKSTKLEPLDVTGFILFGIAFAILLFLFEAFGENILSVAKSLILLFIMLILFFVYFYSSKNKTSPLLNLNLLTLKTFRVTITGSLLIRICMGGFILLFMMLLQLVFGYTPLHAGLFLVPDAIGMVICLLVYKKLVKQFRLKRLLIVSIIILAATFIAISKFTPQTPIIIMLCIIFINGINIAILFSTMNLALYSDVAKLQMTKAVNLYSVVQEGGLSLGVGFAMLVLELLLGTKVLNINISNLATFQHTFQILAACMFFPLLIFLCLPKNTGEHMRH